MIDTKLLSFFKNKANPNGYFNYLYSDDNGGRVMDAGYALSNIALGGALNRVDNQIIDMVFQKRKIEEIVGGRRQAMSFTDDVLETPRVKYSGEPSKYNDFSNPNALGMNVDVLKTKQVRDSINVRFGDLETTQLDRYGVSETRFALGGALNTLLAKWNKTCFFGGDGVQGLISYDTLSEFITLESETDSLDYAKLLDDIKLLFKELQGQCNHVNYDTPMKLAMSPALSSGLLLEGNMQKTLKAVLLETFPKLEIVTSVTEFSGAYNDKSIIYLIAETKDDGSIIQNTIDLPYSEMALFGRVVQKENHSSQNISIGHAGLIVNKEQNIVRGVVKNGNA